MGGIFFFPRSRPNTVSEIDGQAGAKLKYIVIIANNTLDGHQHLMACNQRGRYANKVPEHVLSTQEAAAAAAAAAGSTLDQA
jgi:hypothetical protein